MARRERALALLTLALLNVFTITTGLLVLRHPPYPSRPTAASPPPPLVRATAVLTPSGANSPLPAPGGLAASLSGPLAAAALAGHVAGVVIDPLSRQTLFSHNGDVAAIPASTTKLATGTAALLALGPDHRIDTRVVRGAQPGTIVLVGGGDPTLTALPISATDYPQPASLADLARATARALTAAGTTTVTLRFDDTLYSGPQLGPGWRPTYVTEGDVTPVTALETDEGYLDPRGRTRAPDPAARAATQFAQLLNRFGIQVNGDPRREQAPQAAQELAKVSSPPLSALVERMLTFSDNDLAEALARQVARAQRQPASFDGAAQAVMTVLRRAGVGAGIAVNDGSGLSDLNRITPDALARLLTLAVSGTHPELRPLVSGLPVARFSGTLAFRYGQGEAAGGAGVVRAKTGTLEGVSTLAGLAYDDDGRLLAFAFMANKVPASGVAAAETALDRLAATVAGCGCR